MACRAEAYTNVNAARIIARLLAAAGGVRRVTLPLGTACKAGASLFSHGPMNRM